MVDYPNDWEIRQLVDVASDERYSFTGGPFGSNLKADSYTDTGVRIIQLQNIGDGEFLNNSKIYTSVEKADELFSCNIYPGDIILSKMGDPVARATLIPDIEARYLMASDGIRLKVNVERYSTCYILNFINSSYFRNNAFRHSTGSTRRRISLNDLKRLPILVPPLAEQKAIAQILGTWDEAITLTQSLIDALTRRKRALMQRLLTGEVRFPGFAGEWEEVTLGDVVDVVMGQSPSSENYNSDGEGFPLIQGNADIENRLSNPRNFTTEITKLCDVGDILLSVRAPVGETAMSIHKAVLGRGVSAIRAKTVESKFLYQLLLAIEPKWQKYAQGSTFSAINSKDIRMFNLDLPLNTNEQSLIGNVLESEDKAISNLIQQIEKLQEQKRGLMQVLLTGQVRVDVEG